MSQSMMSRREDAIFRVAAYVLLVAAGLVGNILAPTPAIRLPMIIILLAIAVIQTLAPKADSPRWMIHLYLGLVSTLVTVLMFLVPGWTMFPVILCMQSFQAILFLSPRPGYLWVAAHILLISIALGINGGWGDGLAAFAVYGGANVFFMAYATAMVRADVARRESQSLLAELQEAHQKLQDYALRAEELAIVEERNRLAREMHDTLGHRLTVSSVQLEGAQRLCTQDHEKAAEMVGTVREQIREALAELRSTVATLRAPIEADLHLRSSLRRLMANFEEITGLTIHQVLPEKMPAMPETHRLALYRAAQEALTNVQRHAQASQVWLVLSVSNGGITLLVGDDGRGLSTSADEEGFGLRGMGERAAQLEGELYVEPRPGGGTQISFHLPLPKKDGTDILAPEAGQTRQAAGESRPERPRQREG